MALTLQLVRGVKMFRVIDTKRNICFLSVVSAFRDAVICIGSLIKTQTIKSRFGSSVIAHFRRLIVGVFCALTRHSSIFICPCGGGCGDLLSRCVGSSLISVFSPQTDHMCTFSACVAMLMLFFW